MDGQQYTLDGIRRYEFIFGKTFVSTGGQETTDEFVRQLRLRSGDKVLDVGCGIGNIESVIISVKEIPYSVRTISGGSAFHMARLYNAKVHGIDLSRNMISIGVEYCQEMEESVRENVSLCFG